MSTDARRDGTPSTQPHRKNKPQSTTGPSEAAVGTDGSTGPSSEPVDAALLARLEELVPAWLTVPDIVELTGRPVTLVRAWIKDGELVAVRRRSSEGRLIVSIPADFVTDEGPLHHLPGTLTVLADSRMSGEEAIEWLYRPDSSWRTGSAISDLLAGHKTEVRRRAQELAY